MYFAPFDFAIVLALTGATLSSETAASPEALASIGVFNPTGWEEPITVEVPVGRLATPGLIDWSRVRLAAEDGRNVPFAIREGRPHWKTRLGPVTEPRAEDILVFPLAAQPSAWIRVDIVPGRSPEGSAITEAGERLEISYHALRAAVDPKTAMLMALESRGEPLLAAPMTAAFQEISGDGTRRKLDSPRVRLAGKSSGPAMTEIHFVLEAGDRLAIALSYRFHASGLVEISSDERPWTGDSPWRNRAVEFALPLVPFHPLYGEGRVGHREALPLLENRAPFYGFKDFAAAVRHPAAIHRGGRMVVLELGLETSNGRRWCRRLFPAPAVEPGRLRELVELADEGPIIEVEPRTFGIKGNEVLVTHPPGCSAAAEFLARALRASGIEAKTAAEGPGSAGSAITLGLHDPREEPGIEADGFAIRPRPDGKGVSITTLTRCGLMTAAVRAAEVLRRSGEAVLFPLHACNPAAPVRGAGFGGGDFEVDFPYGSEDEWRETLDRLAASGMSVFADLGMWSNWKMPVSFRGMPELRDGGPEAYDEVSGAKLSEIALHRERGLRLLEFLHGRGAKVWLWLPTGCVPTTYARAHPEAMAPGNDRCPCFTHPLYGRFLAAFLEELLETYPIDGIVMIRDDNGGLCSCERCKAHAAASPTRSAAWEQYLILHRRLRASGFRGDIAVYPYFDLYEPRLDPLLPRDLLIVGHGSGAALLVRDYDRVAPMGDTWLDNVAAGFRVPTAARMKRLLAGWSSFWLGGALRGSELPWEAIGRFGWEPTLTVNSLRHELGARRFGRGLALDHVRLADAYEELWEIYDLPMLPQEWVKRAPAERRDAAAWGRAVLGLFRQRLGALEEASGRGGGDPWFRHLALFGTYFEYHLRRLEVLSESLAIVLEHRKVLEGAGSLPAPVRERLLDLHREVAALAGRFDREMGTVPGAMLERTRAMGFNRPFREFVNGYDPSLEGLLEVRQFAGEISAPVEEVRAGEPFALRLGLRNAGLWSWDEGVRPSIRIEGEAKLLGLPDRRDLDGPPMAFGDRREIEIRGTAPAGAGDATIKLVLVAPFRSPFPIAERTVKVRRR
jgi:hypothetical protein